MILSKDADIDAANQYGTTALLNAIENNKTEVAELLLKHRADVNARDEYGGSPLHAATKIGNLQIVQHLLKGGANVNCEYISGLRKGYKPLHFAVERGSKEVVTMLLERGANVDVKGEDGITPLHIAAKGGYVSIAEDLLNHGATMQPCNRGLMFRGEGYTPLHFASEVGNEETVKLFINSGADINASAKDNLTPLHIATKNGRKIVVQLLLQHGAEVDNQVNDGKTILHLAVEKGCSVITEAILKYCPDINIQSNRNSLETAVFRYGGTESKKIVEALLEYGLNFNPEDANNSRLLHAAVEKGYLKIVEDLLKYGADVNTSQNTFKRGVTPLHSAAKHKQEEVAELLIRYEADINAQDGDGKTPIYYAVESADLKITKLLLPKVKASSELLNLAVEKGCVEIVEALLQHGAHVNASDECGRTALHSTALSERGCLRRYFDEADDNISDINVKVDIAKLLISKGANVDAQTKHGLTTFHAAAQKGYVELVKVLLECGAKVNSKTKSNTTPLHLAAEKGYEEIVEMILKFGADVNSRDEHGRTALHIASREGHLTVVSTLLGYGSDVNITSGDNCTPLDFTMDKIRSFYSQPITSTFYDSDDDEYYVVNRGICSCDVTAEALKCHIVKMKAANLYVSEQNVLSVSSSDEMSDFLCECEEEIASMKIQKINNAIISFYDILVKDTSSLAICMRNENIVQALKADDYKTKFPIYTSMIESNFRKGMERKELHEQGNNILHFLFNNFSELPHVYTEKIFSYLSNEDLRILIDACKPLCIST